MGKFSLSLISYINSFSRSQCFDDLWVLDLDTHIWVAVHIPLSDTTICAPSARKDHAMCVTPSGDIYLFGGQDNKAYASGDWWRFRFGELLAKLEHFSSPSLFFDPAILHQGGDIYVCGSGGSGQVN